MGQTRFDDLPPESEKDRYYRTGFNGDGTDDEGESSWQDDDPVDLAYSRGLNDQPVFLTCPICGWRNREPIIFDPIQEGPEDAEKAIRAEHEEKRPDCNGVPIATTRNKIRVHVAA